MKRTAKRYRKIFLRCNLANNFTIFVLHLDMNLYPTFEILGIPAAGTSINFAFCEEIRKFCLAFYNGGLLKIFGSINQ